MTGMRDGPSLQDYIETRFNLLADAVRDAERSHREELLRFAQEAKDAASALRHFVELGREETDLRYQQRFEAQSAALAAAFLSQQTAMQTAFQVAEKAVQAALAAADRAVSKAELAGDKRFEALNELRQMLNDMVATLITRQEAIQRFDAVAEKVEKADHRVEAIEARLNRMTGGQEGGQERRQNLRASTGVAVSIGSGILGLIGLLIVLWKLSVGR